MLWWNSLRIWSFNPYSTGFSSFITLFLLASNLKLYSFNPYFIGLPILISNGDLIDIYIKEVSILILLDYLFLSENEVQSKEVMLMFQSLFYWITYSYNGSTSLVSTLFNCFNPYFIGLPILILSVEKTFYLLLLQSFFQTLKSSFFRFF